MELIPARNISAIYADEFITNAIVPQIKAEISSPSAAVVPKNTMKTCTNNGVPLKNSIYIEAIQDNGLNLLNFISAINAPKIAPNTTPINEIKIVFSNPLIKKLLYFV
ncbi:Uncharacterised protein [Streptococcus pneumoniae]|nr:Uncharacterised protein [Streptococcus pneumoniae]